MDLAHLRYFLTIVQCGSLTAAAKVLRVSQPTLSVAVQHLEQQLGTTLLLRTRSGVTATRTGEELCRHAAEIFTLLERAEQEIKGIESGDVGRFILGCHESLGAYFLPGFMARFLVEAPRIELSLWNGSSAAVLHAVISHQVNFGLVVNPTPHPEAVLIPLFHDAMDLFVCAPEETGDVTTDVTTDGGAVASLDNAWARLRGGPLIYAGRVHQCQELIERLAAESLLPRRMLSCGDLELVKSLALAGLGVAMLPRRVAHYGQPGRLVRLHPALPSFPDVISLVFRADLHRTRAALRLKDALVDYGKKLDEA